ncbi:hypothetical protein MHI04_10865 [Lysinibacillus sp. FSL K6-1151]|uniref:hypothetical protein n=1 Tax=Lysinibacillus sp. FSL K6-1151 TaxID=2921465 RepID=UPI00315B2431
MNIYLSETEYAVSSLIDLIRNEEIALEKLSSSLSLLIKQQPYLYNDFLSKDLDPDDNFNEHHTMHAFSKQAANTVSIKNTEVEIEKLKASISSKEESIKALSGALLQIAKQGISIVHGKLDPCPDGRYINNEPIKNIIWQARNQSLHYEEGSHRAAVTNCFANLGITLNGDNLAKEIIDLLGWTTYQNYKTDLISLLG